MTDLETRVAAALRKQLVSTSCGFEISSATKAAIAAVREWDREQARAYVMPAPRSQNATGGKAPHDQH